MRIFFIAASSFCVGVGSSSVEHISMWATVLVGWIVAQILDLAAVCISQTLRTIGCFAPVVIWNSSAAFLVSLASFGGWTHGSVTAAFFTGSISTVLCVCRAGTGICSCVIKEWCSAANRLALELAMCVWALDMRCSTANVRCASSIWAFSFWGTASSTLPWVEFWAVLFSFCASRNNTMLIDFSVSWYICVVSVIIGRDFAAANVGVVGEINTSIKAVEWMS